MGRRRTWGQRLGMTGLVIFIVALLVLAAWIAATRWRPSLDDYPLQGIDVSEATGTIDWPVARAAGADFAYIRATSGTDRRDAAFAGNWAGAHAAGVRRGAIHRYSLCRLASDQANLFMITVPRVSDALPAAVLIDDGADCGAPPARAVVVDELARFARMVESHTGKPLMLMITPAVEAKYDLARAFERPLWATGNFFPPTYLSRPWRMWQANRRRRIEGAEQAVGWDVVAP